MALSLKSSLHQRFTTRWNCCRASCSGVNWSISAQHKLADCVICRHYCWQRPILEHKTCHSIEQPTGTHTFWDDLWFAEKCPSWSEYRTKEKCRSLVFFQSTWITMCWKVIIEFLPDDTKNKQPTPTWRQYVKLILRVWVQESVPSERTFLPARPNLTNWQKQN